MHLNICILVSPTLVSIGTQAAESGFFLRYHNQYSPPPPILIPCIYIYIYMVYLTTVSVAYTTRV